MTQAGATAEARWAAFRALSPDERDGMLRRMLAYVVVREALEDVLDLARAERRAGGSRLLDEVLAELEP